MPYKDNTSLATLQPVTICDQSYDQKQAESRIFTIRGVQVMFDRDLAEFYGITTGNLNKAVKRNINRFPKDFMFQLTKEEVENLKSQSGTSSAETDSSRFQFGSMKGRGSNVKYLPYVSSRSKVYRS